jgi:hypothetical protein
LSWNVQPFGSGSCEIRYPLTHSADECQLFSQSQEAKNTLFIQFPFSLDHLQANEQNALTATIQQLLDSRVKRENLEAGDHYLRYGSTTQVSEPLMMEQRFQLVTQTQERYACDGITLGEGCNLNGASCLRFCSFPIWPHTTDETQHWTIAVLFETTWSYFSQDGKPLYTEYERQVGSQALRLQYLSLDVAYEQGKWQVAFYTNNQSSFDDPYCIDLNGQLLGGRGVQNYRQPVVQPYEPDAVVSFNWFYESQSSAQSGCLAYTRANVTVNQGDQKALTEDLDKNPLRLYYHAGILLALDERTRQYWPDLPLATAHERNLAMQSKK